MTKRIVTCRSCGYETATVLETLRCTRCSVRNHVENNVDRRRGRGKEDEQVI